MSEQESPRRMTLLVVMLVIAFGLVVAGVMLVTHLRTKQMAYNQMCGMHQSQLMGALIAYSTQENDAWPIPAGASAHSVRNAHDARQMTCRMFALIVRQQSLPVSMFKCPRSIHPAPPKLGAGEAPPNWGLSPAGVIAYAFDWASPPDPLSVRVIIADRDPTAHGNGVMACFGDGHVKKLKPTSGPVVRPSTALVTEDVDGKPITVSVGNPEAGGDDIYSTDGDGGDPLTPAKGDPRRAWVK